MALPNARQQYLKTQVETASKEQLVVMLFDGILRFTEIARKAIEGKQIEDSHHALMRAQAIVMELICTVDKEKGGEIASNLMALHAYAFNCLITANMKKDVSKLDEVQNIYRKLREGWVGAMENLGITASSATTNGGQPAPKSPTPPPARTPGPAPIPKAPPSAGMRSMPTGTPGAPKPTTGPGGIIANAKPVVLGAAPAAPKAPAPAKPNTYPNMRPQVLPSGAATAPAAQAKPVIPAAIKPATQAQAPAPAASAMPRATAAAPAPTSAAPRPVTPGPRPVAPTPAASPKQAQAAPTGQTVPATPAPTQPAQAPAAPKPNLGGAYGMGRAAMLGAYKPAATPAAASPAPAAAAPAATPASAPAPAAATPAASGAAAPSASAKAAMLNAYSAGKRNIA